MAANMAAEARAESATAETSGGAEAAGRDVGGKPSRPRAPRGPMRRFSTAWSPNCCLKLGIGTLILARGATPHHLAFGSFLLDVFCLGIKDVMFESLESDEFAMYVEATDAGASLVSIDPHHARKLLRDLAAWSQSIGFAPHRDFAAVERIFGDVSADESEVDFQFGSDGKPLYIPGPFESATLIRRRIEQLQKHLGDDGFEFETAA